MLEIDGNWCKNTPEGTGSVSSERYGNETLSAVFSEPLFFLNSGVYGGNFKISNMAAEKKKRRKRRGSTCALKPPLDFIESPLNGQKYYCTPVQAARRPFLAASLPVDDEVSMKWVGIRASCNKKHFFSKSVPLTHCCLCFFRSSSR